MLCLSILSGLTALGCRRSDPLCCACAKWRNSWWLQVRDCAYVFLRWTPNI